MVISLHLATLCPILFILIFLILFISISFYLSLYLFFLPILFPFRSFDRVMKISGDVLRGNEVVLGTATTTTTSLPLPHYQHHYHSTPNTAYSTPTPSICNINNTNNSSPASLRSLPSKLVLDNSSSSSNNTSIPRHHNYNTSATDTSNNRFTSSNAIGNVVGTSDNKNGSAKGNSKTASVIPKTNRSFSFDKFRIRFGISNSNTDHEGKRSVDDTSLSLSNSASNKEESIPPTSGATQPLISATQTSSGATPQQGGRRSDLIHIPPLML